MAFGALTYSRAIAWLKILLPLMALAILSTLFLLARPTYQEATLPFAQIEVEEKLRAQGITNPFFAGQTETGDAISMTAAFARPNPDALHLADTQNIDVMIEFIDGSHARFLAGQAQMNTRKQTVVMSQNVQITSSTGIKLAAQNLWIDLLNGSAETQDTVSGNAPFGTFQAGSMSLSTSEAEGKARFRFDKGVKLVYTPSTE